MVWKWRWKLYFRFSRLLFWFSFWITDKMSSRFQMPWWGSTHPLCGRNIFSRGRDYMHKLQCWTIFIGRGEQLFNMPSRNLFLCRRSDMQHGSSRHIFWK